MNISKSQELFSRAQQSIPGGVNSPVRAFKSVGGTPLFISKAKGAYLFDADGNKYIDFISLFIVDFCSLEFYKLHNDLLEI